ncbi:hypothetical protein [Phycicoccus sonneratiae]|uniref:ANTAR domain-containing protein n=1 Tax=Phycicoccus sonneratiae TaxID=2807628 RepID=A0ABS2CRS6_9MICO|nr:hypothetical protein [Phycicoccus sonneraticus]MBM6402163.1 hypothetical protein [Phycicoccus sonneraticus]
MGRREGKIEARREAAASQLLLRAQRREQDDRCGRLGIVVVLALQERDAWVEECERRAGDALTRLVEEEGLSVRDAVGWCVGAVTVADATRLRRLAAQPSGDGERPTTGQAQ